MRRASDPRSFHHLHTEVYIKMVHPHSHHQGGHHHPLQEGLNLEKSIQASLIVPRQGTLSPGQKGFSFIPLHETESLPRHVPTWERGRQRQSQLRSS